VDVHRGQNPRRYGLFVVHSVDRHSNKSALVSPRLGELAKRAQESSKRLSVSVPIEPAQTLTRSLRRRFAPKTIEEMVTRYTAGEAIRALSLEYGISRSGLRQLLQNEKMVLREQGITPEDVERAVQLYSQGMTLVQVAEQVGSSYGTLRKVFHEHGVVMRACGQRRRSDP
jgi:hypothetical protein